MEMALAERHQAGADLDVQLDAVKQQLTGLQEQVSDFATKEDKYRVQLQKLNHTIADLQDSIVNLRQNKEVLEAEVERLENLVMDQKGRLDAKKEELETQVQDLTEQNRKASEQLLSTMSKDKEVRDSWTLEHIKLDKKREALRRLQLKLGGAEQRIAELENYGKL